ncbi:hypothetical protein KY311_03900, partial [Candidatus Woesearchaeota archaeon]|nr:hypothetical protein [Candidatus Woesearchaeota archaeon]
NTALANGITLGWLALQSMRYLFGGHFEGIWLRFVVNLVILFYAGLIVYFSFSHKISAKWSFLLASPTPVYFLGTFAVLWGFGVLSVDAYVFLDILILYLLVGILIMLFRKMVKPAIV